MENTITRKELYDFVWTETVKTLSEKFGVTDYELRNICKKNNIPLPRSGYWTKIRHGKEVSRTPLPMEKNKESKQKITIETIPPKQTPIQIRTKEILDSSDLPLKVPVKLSNPHQLIISAKRTLNNNPFEQWRYKGLLSPRDEALDISATSKIVPRALRFMNALIKLLLARGHNMILENGYTFVLIEEEKIQISLRERFNSIETTDKYGWKNRNYTPSGKLALRLHDIWVRKEWYDGRSLLEDQLAKILAYLEIYAAKEKQERIERDAWHRKYEEERRIENEIRERKEKELTDFNTLLKIALRWQKASFLRDYVRELESYAKRNHKLNTDTQEWITWALNKADWYDPLISKEDPILGKYVDD